MPKKKMVATEIVVLFLLYVALGISLEAIFTGFGDIIRNYVAGKPFNANLPCRTSLWIIPVYGVSATVAFSFVGVFTPGLLRWSWWARGLVYMLVIYGFEYIWAFLLDGLLDIRVWEYTNSKYRIWRYISPYFCLVWFVFGFMLEWVKVKILPRLIR